MAGIIVWGTQRKECIPTYIHPHHPDVKAPEFQKRTSAFLKPFCVEACINFHMSPLMYPCGLRPHGYIKGDI